MPLAPALARLLGAKQAHPVPPQWELPIATVRANFAALWSPAMTGTPPVLASIEDRCIADGVPVRIYRPHTAGRTAMQMYFHGGGWVKGGLDEADAFCRRLAHATGRVTVAVGYRLAPEHPFPAALNDAWAATGWAYAHAGDLGATTRAFAVCGESAGGNLAAVVSRLARDDATVAIARQVLLQPVTDLTLSFPSIDLPAAECLVPRDDLAWYYQAYAGSHADRRDPRLSPWWAEDVAGLPAALVIAAEYDSLRDEADAYGRKLAAAGVEVRYRCYPGMVHGFLQMAGLIEEARQAIDAIAAFLAD